MVDKALGIIVIAFGVTALAIIVSRRARTARVLNSLLGGIAKMQRAAASPLK